MKNCHNFLNHPPLPIFKLNSLAKHIHLFNHRFDTARNNTSLTHLELIKYSIQFVVTKSGCFITQFKGHRLKLPKLSCFVFYNIYSTQTIRFFCITHVSKQFVKISFQGVFSTKSITLKVPTMTVADDKFCDIFLDFMENKA